MNNKTKKSRKNYDTEKPLQFFPDFPLQVPPAIPIAKGFFMGRTSLVLDKTMIPRFFV